MEQALKYRFWIASGVVLVLIVGDFFLSASRVAGMAEAKRKEVQDAESQVKSLAGRSDLPNERFVDHATKRREEALTELAKIQKSLFEPQQEIFQWMEPVRKLTPVRPEPISVDQMQKTLALLKSSYSSRDMRRFLVAFKADYEGWMDRLERQLDPITDENPSGKMYVRDGALKREEFGVATPNLALVRRVQEDMWIQQEVVRAIKAVNAEAKNIRTAPIKKLSEVFIGGKGAADSEAQGGVQKGTSGMSPMGPGMAPDMGGGPPMGGGMGGGRGGGRSRGEFDGEGKVARYLFRTRAEYSVLPVKIIVQVEQDKLERLIQEVSKSKLNFVLSQVEEMAKATGLALPVARPSSGRSGMPARLARHRRRPDSTEAVSEARGGREGNLPAQLQATVCFRVYIYKRSKKQLAGELAALKEQLEEEQKKEKAEEKKRAATAKQKVTAAAATTQPATQALATTQPSAATAPTKLPTVHAAATAPATQRTK